MPDPWDRQEGETKRGHAAFLDYCAMGPGRSLTHLWHLYRHQSDTEATQRPPTKRLRTLKGWSTDNDWQERVAAWDVSLRSPEQSRWAEFMERQRDKEAALVDEMLEKVRQMLRFPVTRVTSKEGGQVTITEPAKWRMGDVARIADSMAKLARLAAEQPTERKVLTIDRVLAALPDDVRRAVVAALEADLPDE